MATSTARQSFRETVALVAAKAKERLPEAVNGRIESAAKLVLLHDVMPQPDGSILVGSSTDPMKSYLLAGSACECQDWRHGKAPGGWCQHRIAAGIHKRVGEVLATSEPQAPPVELPADLEVWPDNDSTQAAEPPAPPQPLPEAPASVNVRVMICGREVQWTLRDTDETRLAVRLEALLARYPKPAAAQYPVEAPAPGQQLTPQQHNALAMGATVEGVCPIHSVHMKFNEGRDGKKGWWSHKTSDGWCKGR